MEDEVAMFDSALTDYEKGQAVLDMKLSSALETLNSSFSSLEAISNEGKRQYRESRNLLDLMSELRPNLAPEQVEAFQSRLEVIRQHLDRLKTIEPRRGTCCLRLFLGERINTKVWKRSELFAMKNSYNTFKARSTVIFMAFPVIQLLLVQNRFVGILHQLWLLYFYVSLSLREGLLLCNGSRIEQWWIVHHYIAAISCIITLTWPDTAGYRWFVGHFAVLMFWQGIIMILQSQYQNRRHYVRTSLGKAGELDISSSETIVEKPTDLAILIPLLYLTYVCQVFTGVTLLLKSRQLHETGWNMVVNGLLIILLGIGNGIATTRVMFKKRTQRRQQITGQKKRSL